MNLASSWLASGALMLCFILFSKASFRHFDPRSRSLGNLMIRILTVSGSMLGLVLVCAAQPVHFANSLLAVALAVASLWIFLSALHSAPVASLHVAFTGSGPQDLVTSGIYGRIRNPLYTSYLAYWAAWVPATGLHLASVACFALFFVVYWIAVRDEEAFLSAQFGDQYIAFKLRTGRFLPRLN